MIAFPKDFPDKLRSSILTSEVVAKKVKLKAHGKDFLGLCPFHNEKTPSFTVNDSKGFYHCFGCQAHGDIISFIMNSESLDFVDSVKKIAHDFNIEIPKVIHNKQQYEKVNRSLLLTEKICNIFEENIQEAYGFKAREYLSSRGISQNTIKKFRIGYAIDSYEFLSKKLYSLGFSEQEILTSGVVAKNDNGKIYDKLRNRIIFPITNRSNQVIAFGGRVLNSDLPKYLNSSETDAFKKNQTLYNLSQAKKYIFEKKYAIIVEGYMDVISLDVAGIKNSVAGLGTAISVNHLSELFNLTDKIILCLDGDVAGIKAAKRVAEISLPLINSRKNISFVFLPNNMDPDDFVKKFSSKDLIDLIENKAINLSQAMFDFTKNDLDLENKESLKPEDKAKIEILLMKRIDAIKDITTKKYFSQFFKEKLFSFGRRDHKKPQPNNLSLEINNKNLKLNNINKDDNIAKNIIAFLLKFRFLKDYQDENFDFKEFNLNNNKFTEIKDKIIEISEENPQISEENMLLNLENYGYSNYIKDIRLVFENISCHYSGQEDVKEITKKMRLLLLKELLAQIDSQYKEQLLKIDDRATHQTEIIDNKIKELFSQKNKIEALIFNIERDI